uniref:conserved oligomeric Golgi complex subunit 4-like n=1 Tax=Erigeron canadensis TaxID=72917 RepID=UPI001CB9271D|nr:conserved oligomeric Golgi complex subunit 4-like [Erigeron canadensis]
MTSSPLTPPPPETEEQPTTTTTTTTNQSTKFGTPKSISQIQTLTDVTTMQRHLHEFRAYQRTLDTHLESRLNLRPDLDKHLNFLKELSDTLVPLQSEADHMLSIISSTCILADQKLKRVRELDLAISRVGETLLRLDAIKKKTNCIDGVIKSLEFEDFENASSYVETFFSIDAKFKDSGCDQRDRMLGYKKELESIVRKRLGLGVEKRDHESVLRFIKLYSPLGLEEEGLQVYVSYLRKVINLRSKVEFEQLCEGMETGQGEVNFVKCLNNLFRDIALAVEENVDVLMSLCAEDGIVYAICELQEECDSRGSLILKKYMEYRKLSKLTSEINSYKSDLMSNEGPDPRKIQVFLDEILLLTQLGEEYTEYMVSKIKGLSHVAPELVPKATKSFRSGNFSKVAQDMTSYYVVLEGFCMVENVRKAIKIDGPLMDSFTTSMVNDVFYVLRDSCHRSRSTSNINSVIATLSGAVSLLAGEYTDALQQKMREPNLVGKLFLGGVGVQKTGIDIATALNNMDVSSEYALKLRHEIEEKCAKVFPAPADRERIKWCLSELGELSNAFKKTLVAGLEQLVGTITLRIRPVLDSVATVSYELSEAEYAENEVNDPWVQRLLHAVETNSGWLQSLMTANNYDSFVHLVIDFIVKRLELIMMQKRFSQLGGLQLDRDVRALVSYFSCMTQRTVRDKFSRLTQMATILDLEKVSEILDFWGDNSGPMTWRLTPAEVRRVLGMRVDFKPEAIAALKL